MRLPCGRSEPFLTAVNFSVTVRAIQSHYTLFNLIEHFEYKEDGFNEQGCPFGEVEARRVLVTR
jgi:hypothetical protein